MTLSSQNPPEKKPADKKPDKKTSVKNDYLLSKRPVRADGKIDNDIRNHPDYKTPWWRKPMGRGQYWAVLIGAVVIVGAAIIITLSLGVKLF